MAKRTDERNITDTYYTNTAIIDEDDDWTSVNIVKGATEAIVRAETSAAGDYRIVTNPKINQVWWYDASASGACQWKDMLATQDLTCAACTTAFTIVAMGVCDHIYVGARTRHKGVYFDIGTGNTVECTTMTATYSAFNNVWTASAGTDDTLGANSTTLELDGTWTFTTIPSATVWHAKSLREMGDQNFPTDDARGDEQLYWSRYSPSCCALGNVTVSNIMAINARAVSAGSNAGDAEGAGVLQKDTIEYTYPVSDELGGFSAMLCGSCLTGTMHISWIFKD